ncbi:hypothetical protein L1887_24312 [Cichorium endivia]|nr:hypothetical protein L1887_24312 [Cichorium endivia]
MHIPQRSDPPLLCLEAHLAYSHSLKKVGASLNRFFDIHSFAALYGVYSPQSLMVLSLAEMHIPQRSDPPLLCSEAHLAYSHSLKKVGASLNRFFDIHSFAALYGVYSPQSLMVLSLAEMHIPQRSDPPLLCSEAHLAYSHSLKKVGASLNRFFDIHSFAALYGVYSPQSLMVLSLVLNLPPQ